MAETEFKHPLNTGWSLWFDPSSGAKSTTDWGNRLNRVYTFNFVEDFWSLWAHIKPANEIAQGKDYNYFRDGIDPAWEHEANKGGGKWQLSIPAKQRATLNEKWLHTLLACIGESLEEYDSPQSLVCGAVLSVRKSQDRIAIWIRKIEEQDRILAIGEKFRAALLPVLENDSLQFTYTPHEAVMVAAKSKNAQPTLTLPPLHK